MIIIIILVIGFLVRIWGISHLSYNLDEGMTIYTAFYAASNNLGPDNFLHPMLYPTLLIVLYLGYFIIGSLLDMWSSTWEFFIAYVSDPSMFYSLGRMLTVSIGVASIWMVYWVGRRTYSKNIGLIAAIFLSLSFLHVQESHYIKEDVFIGFLSLLAFYLSVGIAKKKGIKNYLILGVILGLLFSLKYNFFILLPMFVFAHTLRMWKKGEVIKSFFAKEFWFTIGITAFVFVILNPYVIIRHKEAIYGIIRQMQLSTIQWVDSGGQPVWIYYLTYHLSYGIGLPLLATMICGLLYILIKNRKAENVLLVTTPIMFFVTLIIFGGPNFARYAVMIIPQLAIIAAIAVDRFSKQVKIFGINKSITVIALSVIIIFPSLLRVIKFDYYSVQKDTRILAKDWIESHITKKSRTVNEGAFQPEYPSTFGPPLEMDEDSVRRKIAEVRKKGQKGNYLKALLASRIGKIGYDIYGTIELDKKYDFETSKYIQLSGVEYYVDLGYCYVITSSRAKKNGNDYSPLFKKSLNENYKIIKKFLPTPKFRDDFSWRVDFVALDRVNLFYSGIIQGPEITIYKLKNGSKC